LKTLTFAHPNPHSFIDIYEDYVKGIKENSSQNWFVDYKEEYIRKGKRSFEKYILDLIINNNIETIFFVLDSEDLTFDIKFIKQLSKHCFIIMNFFDTEYFFEEVDRHYAQFADLVMLPDYNTKFMYELYDINAICTFSLFDADKYTNTNLSKDIDVSFVGDISKSNRREYIKYLEDKGIVVEIYGKNTDNGIISFEKMIEVFNRTKINLNLTSYDFKAHLSKDINQRIKQSKGRPIEITLCKSFCLSEEASGIKHMFDVDVEIDIFRSKEELLEKIIFYLGNDKIVNKMANDAFDKAKINYTNITGFKKVFDLIRITEKKKKYYIEDNIFLNNYISFRYYYMTIAILNLNFNSFLDELLTLVKYKKLYGNFPLVYIFKGASDFLNRFPKFKNFIKTFKKKIIKL